jgi:hypothetical protein
VCISNQEGDCKPSTPPVTPPVTVQDCSANICFLLDGSKSLINVDGWNDVVAAARSIMYSIPDPASIFDVFYFSNEVERIGEEVSGWWVGCDAGRGSEWTPLGRRGSSQLAMPHHVRQVLTLPLLLESSLPRLLPADDWRAGGS